MSSLGRNKPRTPKGSLWHTTPEETPPAFSREQLDYLDRAFAVPDIATFNKQDVETRAAKVGQRQVVQHIRQIVNKEME